MGLPIGGTGLASAGGTQRIGFGRRADPSASFPWRFLEAFQTLCLTPPAELRVLVKEVGLHESAVGRA